MDGASAHSIPQGQGTRMDTTPPSMHRFSLRNVLVIVVPVALAAFGYYWYLVHEAEQGPTEDKLHYFLRYHLKAPTKLDDGLSAQPDELVAAAPQDAAKQIDPETLVFSVLGLDADKEESRFADLTQHLSKSIGKKVQIVVPDSIDEQMSELRAGKIHLASVSTGSVTTAVNKGGLVPFAVMADD